MVHPQAASYFSVPVEIQISNARDNSWGLQVVTEGNVHVHSIDFLPCPDFGDKTALLKSTLASLRFPTETHSYCDLTTCTVPDTLRGSHAIHPVGGAWIPNEPVREIHFDSQLSESILDCSGKPKGETTTLTGNMIGFYRDPPPSQNENSSNVDDSLLSAPLSRRSSVSVADTLEVDGDGDSTV